MPFLEVPGPGPTGLRLAYDVEGGGAPIILVHGFASSREINWKGTGWYGTLTKAGRMVVALDVRGHGESDKPHVREAYDEGELAADVVRLMDHLGFERADLMGYSMGGFITLRLLADAPQRLRKAMVAGVGENYYRRTTVDSGAIAAGLRAPSSRDVKEAVPRQFRQFAEHGRNDLEALALCMTRERKSVASFPDVGVPVLIVAGSADSVAGDPQVLAEAVPNAKVAVVPGRDHMQTVGDRHYKEAVLAFLRE
jgi:pimeloyl-ACP methyl ester carboxylesterase